MAPLLNAESLSKAYGSKTLFQDVSLTLSSQDRVGLIGPNGCGKSTFLKILCGIESPDQGSVTKQRHLKIGYVPQMTTYSEETAEEVLLAALSTEKQLDAHELHTRARIVLGKAGFTSPQAPIHTLSGGWKKRLDIAKALVLEPDVLLLDEPTNHLDIEGILWLETFLRRLHIPYILTSHDRNFLESVTTRTVEINASYPKGVFTVDGPYSTFLEKREIFLQGQMQYQKSLASKVAREIDWLRQTPQARTTKSRSRIQQANSLIQELSSVKARSRSSSVHIDFSSTGRKSKKLLVAKNLSKTLQEKKLFAQFALTLTPGMRVAIVGTNGSGKTTLMKVLAGKVPTDTGTLKRAEGLKVVYFDQHRESLPEDISVKKALSPTGETVHFQGRSIHVSSWAKQFLFTSDRLDLPVKQLSGGEKARILIARLMLKPADILFLDEPTNDLDITTLELLEENLRIFPGAVVFITHDRYMLNDLATLFIGLGEGEATLFADYYQWEKEQTAKKERLAEKPPPKKPVKKEASPKRLTYKEKKELEAIEGEILSLEQQITHAEEHLAHPNLAESSDKLQQACQELSEQQCFLEKLYARWQELEDKR